MLPCTAAPIHATPPTPLKFVLHQPLTGIRALIWCVCGCGCGCGCVGEKDYSSPRHASSAGERVCVRERAIVCVCACVRARVQGSRGVSERIVGGQRLA
jgi:hypothetical protein